MPPTIADLVERALSGFDALAVAAEPVDDEIQYVADLGTVWRARLQAVASARGREAAPPGSDAAIDALVAEAARIDDPHRAIDWLSTLPQVALAALGERRLMRFADARPDGRAVVYAHIQADPLVAEAADLLAVASTTQRLLARAVMNGMSTDPTGWRAMFPTLFGPGAPPRATPAGTARRPSSTSRSASPSAASRPAASTAAPSSRP